MADVSAIRLDTKEAISSIRDLKNYVKQLKDELLTLEVGTEEYNKKLVECADAQHKLNEITEQVGRSSQDFGDRLSAVSGTLAGVSGAVQTAVGAFSLMGVEMGDSVKVLKTLQSLMAITSGIAAIDKGVKSFKALTISIKSSTAAQRIFNAVANANPIVKMAGVILTVVGVLAMFTRSNKEAKESQDELNASIEEAKRKEEEYAKQVEETHNKYVEYSTTDEEKAEKLKTQIGNITKEIERVKEQYAGLSEERKKEDQYTEYLEVRYVELSERQKELSEIEAKQRRAREAAEAKRKAAADKALADAKKLEDAQKSYLKAIEQLAQAQMETDMERANRQKALLEMENEKLEANRSKLKQGTKEWYENEAAIAANSLAILNLENTIAGLMDTQDQAERDQADVENERLLRVEKLRQAKELQLAQYELEIERIQRGAAIDQQTEEGKLEALQLEYEMQQRLNELTDQRIDYDIENLRTQLSQGLIELQDYNEGVAELEAERNELELQRMEQRIAFAREEAAQRKAIYEKYYEAVKSITSSIASVLGSVASTLEQGTQQWKNLKIAEAIISTLTGGVDAFMSAMSSGIPYPYNIVAGAASAAGVVASGYAQVDQIRNTKVSKDTAAGSTTSNPIANVSATAVQSLATQVTNTRQTSTDSDIENLPDTRVYVMQGDIDKAQSGRRATIKNATF